MDNRDMTEQYSQPEAQHESPSQLIHNKLLSLRDGLDNVSIKVTEKLSLVMNNHPMPPETAGVNTDSDLPPLFQQYSELIGHIELVIEDINVKLNSVDI